MIKIANAAWREMVSHARSTYPNECCGAMLGISDGAAKRVDISIRLRNSFEGEQSARYELHPEDLLAAEREACARERELIGIYHSHPDCDAYFSQTDLKNSCPWYSFVVLSVRGGEFDHANSWLPDAGQTRAEREELVIEENS